MFDAKQMRTLRERRKMTVMELAVALSNIGHPRSLPTIRTWEKGKVQPRADDLIALAQVFGVKVLTLLILAPET